MMVLEVAKFLCYVLKILMLCLVPHGPYANKGTILQYVIWIMNKIVHLARHRYCGKQCLKRSTERLDFFTNNAQIV